MGAPKGSKNALGNKGGGRKSAYQEFLDAQWHAKAWRGLDEDNKQINVEVLVKRVKSNKYGVRDIYLLKALKGNERILAKFGDKLLPDLKSHMGPNGNSLFDELDLFGEAKKRSAKYHGEKSKAVKKSKKKKKK